MTSEEQSQTAQLEAIRQGTPIALVVTIQSAEDTQTYTCYVYQSSVLIEQKDTDDSAITVATEDLGTYLADLIDPQHWAGEHREVEEFATMDDFADLAARHPVLTETLSLTTLALLDRQTEEAQVCVIYASPDGMAVVEGGPRSDDPDLPYALTEISAEDLLDAPGRLLAGVTLPDPMPIILP